jgi:transcriptional regulator with XRE-family HTH domain
MASKDSDTSKRRRKPATSEVADTGGAERPARTPARGPRQPAKPAKPAKPAAPARSAERAAATPAEQQRRRPPTRARTEQPEQTEQPAPTTQVVPAIPDEPLAAIAAEEATLAEGQLRDVTDEGILADAAISELPPTARVIVVEPSEDESALEEAGEALMLDPAASTPGGRRYRAAHGNALGILIERHFLDAASPCRSYSDLERRSGISREALSRYVTARPDRRRSPTIDTLVAIADAMHISVEAVCRAAAASVKNVVPPPDEIERGREEVLGTLTAALSDDQYSAVVELLRQMRPVSDGYSRRE